MALIKFGPTVVGVRGTVGGITFSANGASPYIKAWAPPVERFSPEQTSQQKKFGSSATAWAVITQAERDDWDTYAAAAAQDLINSLGETYSASGFNWFIKINTQLALAGRAQIDTAPVGARPAAPTLDGDALRETTGGGADLVNVDALDPDFGADVCVLSTYYITHARGFANRARQFLICEQPLGNGLVIITDEVEGKYGNIPSCSRIFYFVHYQDLEGQRGPASTVTSDAVA